jgi:diadenosine tetraphosphate (Ap4A) HIT family hydrolase
LKNADFKNLTGEPMSKSVFQKIPESEYLYRDNHFFIIPDKYPVSDGHLLIVSNRNCIDYFGLTPEEQSALPEVIHQAKHIIEQSHKPDGYNIGMNCREAAGQTVFHFHCHVIPRYEGDVENPRGGLRSLIPGKGDY